ncbi:hemicentin-1-like isoform X2 [Mya arenaria]|uniref:hemicentin-1-like isoform X2 n=1 Tax=Mya arenaria TaxID=6604 RepID=UPI0022E084AB|nr:hemicentin-1-like isoform X2 [Mya arenaria]
MDEYVGFVFISILHFALLCGCADVFLSADRQFVTENSTLTFTCSTLNDVHFAEFYENQKRVVRIGNLDKCSSTIYDPVSNCSCLNLTTYTCTTNPLNRNNYNEIWSCVSYSHQNTGTKSKNNITIDVRVPIASVSISPQQNNSMTINEGEELQLTCETSYGLPAANISWYLENNTDSVYVDYRILNSSKREVDENVDRTKSVKSILTHTVSRGEDGMDVYCNASNEEFIRVSSKAIRLNIQYLPQELVYINGNLSYDTFYMMKNSAIKQSLQCSVQGGNPLAKISWSCYNGIQTDMNTPSSAVSDVSWFARDFNDSTCTCNASHALSWSGSQEVSVQVIFEPSLIICKVGNSELYRGILNVTLASNVELNCSSNGNPKPYNFTWVWPTRNTSSGQFLSVKHVQRSMQGKYTLMVENIMKPSIGPTVKGQANTTFDMHVQYGPSTPTLKLVTNNTNITTSTISVKRNETVRIACIAVGNPTPSYNWSTGHKTQILTTTFDSDTNITCKVSNTIFPTGGMITQASVDASLHVNVLLKPARIICDVGTSKLEWGYLNVTLNSNVTLTCKSDGNPKPNNFTWIWPNRNTSAGHILSLSNVQRSLHGRYTLFVENVMNPTIGPTVKGEANATFDMHIQYQPGTPTFIFETNNSYITTSNISVIRNEEISIACSADGNPPPSYTWSTGHKGQNITTAFDSDTNLTCKVSNTVYPTGAGIIQSAFDSSLQINILYPPDVPVLWIYSSCRKNSTLEQNVLRVLEFDQVRVECFAAGNPEPKCQWTNHSKSRALDISNASKEDTGIYFCNASNTMNTTHGRTVVGRNVSSFYLDIMYPPKITNLNTSVVVLEGVNFSLLCEVKPGNPNVTIHYWTSIQLPASYKSGQNLIIQNISRHDEGIFTCFAQNKIQPTLCTEINGSDVRNVTIDVQYKASIITFTAMNTTIATVHHGDEVSFTCEVDSDPPADTYIVSTNGSVLRNIKGNNLFKYTKNSSCLEDIGQFSCVSANTHNRDKPDIRNVTVVVECSPFYRPNYFQNTTISARPGNFAVLHFSVFSNPPPTQFTWTNISNNMRLTNDTTTSDRIIIHTTNDMSSSLIIKRVEPWDFGNYSVWVENEIGSMNETFRIVEEIPSTSPDHPFINVPPDEQAKTNTIGVVIGGSVGAITAVVITAVVVIIIVYRKMKGTANHDNNNLQLLQDTRHKSGKMETCFDNVLPMSDDASMYEEEKNIYGNIHTNDAFGNTLTIKTLRDTIRQLKLDPLPLFKEFYTLQMGLKYDTKHALKKNNVAKNRYRMVYPYDSSRVVLPFLREDSDSDFINASYIDGFCKPRKYIAAQGPLENTISDTWRMIYSEDVKIIVMVTNLIETGKIKCFKYWPDDRATYGECNVKLDQVEEYADFVVRQITYSMEGTRFERQLVQFHYTSWPDKNVPATALSLVQFWRKVKQSEFVEKTPWIVHCSAGVGRTGTFIALDYLFDQGKVDGKLNVPETVNLLREQRISMIQTKEQYLYLHDAITEILDPVGQIFTPENSLRLLSTATEERKLIKEFKVITNSIVNVKTDIEGNDYDLKKMPDGVLPENICKSIDQTVIPDDLFRPLISTGNDFINAVYIPTYRDAEKYIVTQYPLQNTVLDFVRLLWDHSIEDVVLLDVGDEKRQNKQTVVHQFTAWPGYLNLCEPKPLTNFLQTISRIGGPVVVQCHDGYSRSGLFAALLSIVDRIKTDKEVAIADTVRVVKHRRQAAITDVEQYQFCHEVVFEYLKNRGGNVDDSENQEYVNMTFPKFL